jgi:hypothetical protein
MTKTLDDKLLEMIVAVAVALILTDRTSRCLYNMHNRNLVAKNFEPCQTSLSLSLVTCRDMASLHILPRQLDKMILAKLAAVLAAVPAAVSSFAIRYRNHTDLGHRLWKATLRIVEDFLLVWGARA